MCLGLLASEDVCIMWEPVNFFIIKRCSDEFECERGARAACRKKATVQQHVFFELKTYIYSELPAGL